MGNKPQQEKDQPNVNHADQEQETPPTRYPLSKFVAYQVRSILDNPSEMMRAARQMQMWLDANSTSPEERRALGVKLKSAYELLKSMSEGLFATSIDVTH